VIVIRIGCLEYRLEIDFTWITPRTGRSRNALFQVGSHGIQIFFLNPVVSHFPEGKSEVEIRYNEFRRFSLTPQPPARR
jgi:hypothetical protein